MKRPTHSPRPPRRLAVLAFSMVVLILAPGCVSWEPVMLPTLRWFTSIFS